MAQVDYPAILAEAWAQHLAPRTDNAPTVISTFAGAGGSSLGYSMAGFRELLAVEWDDNAVATFKLNFSDVPVYHGDIAKLSVEQVLSVTGLQPGQLDVFDGSPPCQGFSTAGKRMMDDPRNQLFREYIRLLQGLKPKVFVMENVSGMVKGKMKLVFVEILKELKASGYKVSARLLNAMYFNVPQSRERMIFIGVRNDLEIEPSHPVAEAKPITVRSALHKCLPDILPVKTDTLSNRRADALKQGTNHTERFSMVKLHLDRPSGTIQKSVTPNGTAQLLHPSEKRIVAISELKRLASYSDDYQMYGSFTDRWARIGNSVPPLFMRAIVRHIRSELLSRCYADATEKTPVLVG